MKKPDDMTERDRLCIAITARGFAWSPKESTARLRKRYEKMRREDARDAKNIAPNFLAVAPAPAAVADPLKAAEDAFPAVYDKHGRRVVPNGFRIAKHGDSPVWSLVSGKWTKQINGRGDGMFVADGKFLHDDLICRASDVAASPVADHFADSGKMVAPSARPGPKFKVGDTPTFNNTSLQWHGRTCKIETVEGCPGEWRYKVSGFSSKGLLVYAHEKELVAAPASSAAPFRMPEFTKRCDAGWYTIKGFAAKNTEFRGVHVSELDALSAELARLTAENAKLERAIESWKRSEELWEEREKGKNEENASLRARVAELEKAVDSQGMPKDITGPELAHVIKANNERVTSLESALAAAREESRNRQIALRSANNTIEKARKAFVVFAVEKFRESLTEEVEAEYPTIPDPTEVANGK